MSCLLEDNLMAFVLNHAPARALVIVDLGKISAVSSAVFTTWMTAKSALERVGGELHIADIPVKLMEGIRVRLLEPAFHLHPTESASEVAEQSNETALS